MVPAVLMNATDFSIKFCQASTNENIKKHEEEVVEPWNIKAFAWSDVTDNSKF